MVEHVRRRALLSKIFDKVYVVTNSLKIKKIIENFKGDVIISKKKNIIMVVVEFQKYLVNLNLILLLYYLAMNHF